MRYGYIGVVNRSQRDIDIMKDINVALEAERRFFLSQPAYRDIADQQGTAYLQKALNYHLIRHIAETLPEFKSNLLKRCDQLEKEIGASLTDINYDDPHWKTKTMMMNLLQFAQSFRTELLGQTDQIKLDELSSGAKIEYLFQYKYPTLLKTVEFTDESLMKKQIGFAILNTIGPRAALFTPDKAFDQIVRAQIDKLKEPSMDTLDKTAEVMLRTLDKSLTVLKFCLFATDSGPNLSLYGSNYLMQIFALYLVKIVRVNSNKPYLIYLRCFLDYTQFSSINERN